MDFGITTWTYLGLPYYEVDGHTIKNSPYTPRPNNVVKDLTEIDFDNITIPAIGELLSDIMNTAPPTAFSWDPQKEIWFSTVDVLQRPFGYNDLYNSGFSFISMVPGSGVRYRSFISLFEADGYSWRVEGWKGNYMQMGVGTEIGIYAETISEHLDRTNTTEDDSIPNAFFKFAYESMRHYPVAPDFLWPKVSIKLYVDDELLFSRPEQIHWWLNGFSPNADYAHPNDIRVDVTIDFGSVSVAQAFRENVTEGKSGRIWVSPGLQFTWLSNWSDQKVSFIWR